jgi:hypothetical protein
MCLFAIINCHTLASAAAETMPLVDDGGAEEESDWSASGTGEQEQAALERGDFTAAIM